MRITVNSLQNLCIALIAVWATAPPLAYSPPARILGLVAAVLWMALELLRPSGVMRRPTLPVVLVFIYVGYTAFLEFVSDGAAGILRMLQVYIMLMFVLFHQGRRHNLDSLRPVFWFILVSVPIWHLITIDTLLGENTHAARTIVRSGEEAIALMAEGIGGYGLVYSALLALPSLVWLVYYARRVSPDGIVWPIRKVPSIAPALLILNVGASTTLVLTAGYSIAVATLVIAVAATLNLRGHNPIRLVLLAMFGLVLLLFADEILQTGLNALMPLVEGTNYGKKVGDLLASLNANMAVGTLDDRVERYWRSLIAFLQNPLIGTMSYAATGNHSQIIDTFAQFGIVIGGFFLYFVWFLPFAEMRRSRSTYGAAVGTLLVTTLSFGLNNAFMAAGPMLYLVFPLACHMARAADPTPPRLSLVRHA